MFIVIYKEKDSKAIAAAVEKMLGGWKDDENNKGLV